MFKRKNMEELTSEQIKVLKLKSYRRILVVFILGVILFYLPTMMDMYQKSKNIPLVEEYKNSLVKPDPRLDTFKAYNKWVYEYQKNGVVKNKYGLAVKQPDISKYINVGDTVGYIDIPAIDLKNLPIYEGSTDEVLAKGAGTLGYTSLSIGGKNTMAGITGHSGLANQVYFDNIRNLKIGDKIFLHTLGENLAYKVVKTKVIDPKSVDALDNFNVKDGKDMVALMTCTPLFVNSHRLIVYGQRVTPYDKAKKEPVHWRNLFSLFNLWRLSVGITIIMLLLWFIHVINKTNRKLKKEIKYQK